VVILTVAAEEALAVKEAAVLAVAVEEGNSNFWIGFA
jgi:hypothetical protein